MTLKSNSTVETAFIPTEDNLESVSKYRVKTIPAAGSFGKDLEDPDQLTL